MIVRIRERRKTVEIETKFGYLCREIPSIGMRCMKVEQIRAFRIKFIQYSHQYRRY